MWGMCGTILEKEAICTGEGLNCEPDALRPPFRDLLGCCPSSPPLWAPWPLLARAGPAPSRPLGGKRSSLCLASCFCCCALLLAKPTSHTEIPSTPT